MNGVAAELLACCALAALATAVQVMGSVLGAQEPGDNTYSPGVGVAAARTAKAVAATIASLENILE